MERLTGYNSFGGVYGIGMRCGDNTDTIHAIIKKLAAYEDTGLEPENIEIGWWSPICVNCDGKTEDGHRTETCMYVHYDDYNMRYDKCAKQSKLLYDLAKAYKEGRLVILE